MRLGAQKIRTPIAGINVTVLLQGTVGGGRYVLTAAFVSPLPDDEDVVTKILPKSRRVLR